MKNNTKAGDIVLSKWWQDFLATQQLDTEQGQQFLTYLDLLQTWNKKINLTAITEPQDIVDYHFSDSLMISRTINFAEVATIADVGTGAGFPGLPLKIKYPHLRVFLIEVNQKKIRFLQTVIETLNLHDVHIMSMDWRTFLRTTSHNIQYIFARASLHPQELLRMFKPQSPYRSSILVYWASVQWHPEKNEEQFISQDVDYQVGNKKRKYVFFKK